MPVSPRPTVPVSPNGIPLPDVNLLIPYGCYEGISCINKFGRNSAVASGGTEEIWDGSAAYVFPATALMTKLSQTVNQAALTSDVVEIQGLDANWELVTQDVALDGTNTTTAVDLGTPLIRAFRMEVQTNVVTDSPIRLHNDAENQDYAIISVGNNQTLMAIYTVPAGKRAYLTRYYASVNPGGGAPTTMNIRLWARDNLNLYEKKLKHIRGLDLDASSDFEHTFGPYLEFTEQTDIFITGETSAAAADVSAGFDLIIINEGRSNP